MIWNTETMREHVAQAVHVHRLHGDYCWFICTKVLDSKKYTQFGYTQI